MRIGIDFDNTIVSYDALFHKVALEQAAVPAETPVDKVAVRDHLRKIGQEDTWTGLQGYVYGARMDEALAYDGVIEFIREARLVGHELFVVSHKTRHPFLGPQYDLHAEARSWIARHLSWQGQALLPVENVFFEVTKQEKIARIARCSCEAFIDDLPEILLAEDFPANTARLLFDPETHHGRAAAAGGLRTFRNWQELNEHLCGRYGLAGRWLHARIAGLLARAGVGAEPESVTPCTRGGNNRIYRVETAAGVFAVKQYFRHADDTRDRLAAEDAFLAYANTAAPGATPRLYACDREAGLTLLEFVEGRPIRNGEIGEAHVDAAIAFFRDLNAASVRATARVPVASEACFSIADHIAVIDRRIHRLLKMDPQSDVDTAALELSRRLGVLWQQIAQAIRAGAGAAGLDVDHASEQRCVSPSDFGFHNALATADGRIRFLDFEYAGWDDPAKTAGDFFAQLAVPVPPEHYEHFVHRCMAVLPDPPNGVRRAMLLRPAYQIKWCCIALNVFLPVHLSRRRFADPGLDEAALKWAQIHKAELLLESISPDNTRSH
jgi:hypothetical protein